MNRFKKIIQKLFHKLKHCQRAFYEFILFRYVSDWECFLNSVQIIILERGDNSVNNHKTMKNTSMLM
jgi:hypothetical protein